MILHLGVIDVPYATEGTSTGDVAEILEKQYSVMGNFAALHADEIQELVEIAFAEAIENVLAGQPARLAKPMNQAASDIKKIFTTYLNNEEIAETGQEGVPTAAALAGKRTSLKKMKELKKPRRRVRTRRPSFVDTGMYRNSFKAWAD
jgi:hypothetical protein